MGDSGGWCRVGTCLGAAQRDGRTAQSEASPGALASSAAYFRTAVNGACSGTLNLGAGAQVGWGWWR